MEFYIINPQFFEIRSTQPGHPSVDKSNEYQLPLGSKRHTIRGLDVYDGV